MTTTMADVFLGLGTNLGDKKTNLSMAMEEIRKRVGEITSLSAYYITEPWGFDSQNSFLNAVCKVCTSLSPSEVLSVTQSIERDLGRMKKSINGQYSDRPIDIDILLYDNLVIDTPDLSIPHPLMHKRLFVMEPLTEIDPKLIHPVLHLSMEDILRNLQK